MDRKSRESGTVGLSVPGVAEQASEAIRELNHRTNGSEGLEASQIYFVVAELAAMAHRTEQLCEQLAIVLQKRFGAGQLGTDNADKDIKGAIAKAVTHLQEAAINGSAQGKAYEKAQQSLGYIYDK